MEEIVLIELNSIELVEITGGSKHSELVFSYIGSFFGYLNSFSKGAVKGSANRFS